MVKWSQGKIVKIKSKIKRTVSIKRTAEFISTKKKNCHKTNERLDLNNLKYFISRDKKFRMKITTINQSS